MVTKPTMHISKWQCVTNIVTVPILFKMGQRYHVFSRFCSENEAFDCIEYQLWTQGSTRAGFARRGLQASIIFCWLLLFVGGNWKLRRDQ